ncbi:MAG TPA: hypothetical protein VI072_00610 [Polyangiaceae bacterium]
MSSKRFALFLTLMLPSSLALLACDELTVTITSPTEGAVLSTRCTPLDFSVVGSSGALKYRCAVDSQPEKSCTPGETLCVATDGAHKVKVTAQDARGQTGVGLTHFRVSTGQPAFNPPYGTLLAPSEGQCLSSAQLWQMFYTDEPVTTACRQDAEPYGPCHWTMDGVHRTRTPPESDTYEYLGYGLPLLANGPHSFSVRIENETGGVNETTINFTINAPVITVTVPANGSVIAGTSVTLTFSASLPPLSTGCSWENPLDQFSYPYSCKLDSGAPFTCSPGQVLSGLASGPHFLEISRRFAQNGAGMWGVSRVNFSTQSQ